MINILVIEPREEDEIAANFHAAKEQLFNTEELRAEQSQLQEN